MYPRLPALTRRPSYGRRTRACAPPGRPPHRTSGLERITELSKRPGIWSSAGFWPLWFPGAIRVLGSKIAFAPSCVWGLRGPSLPRLSGSGGLHGFRMFSGRVYLFYGLLAALFSLFPVLGPSTALTIRHVSTRRSRAR